MSDCRQLDLSIESSNSGHRILPLQFPIRKLTIHLEYIHTLLKNHIENIEQLISAYKSVRDSDKNLYLAVRGAISNIGFKPEVVTQGQVNYSEFNITSPEINWISFNESSPELKRRLLCNIESLMFSVRVNRCLKELGVKHVGDLVQLSPFELLHHKSFGKHSFNKVRDKLNEIGLGLHIWLSDWPPTHFAELANVFEDQVNTSKQANALILLNANYLDGVPIDKLPLNSIIQLIRPVEDLDLSVRVRSCLKTLDILFVGELIQTTKEQLLDTPNFGKTCLDEVGSALNQLGLMIGLSVSCLSRDKILELSDIHSHELSKVRDQEAAKLISSDIEGHKIFLEDEFNALLQPLKKQFQREIVAMVFGWGYDSGCTLQKAGNPFGITRERARQLYNIVYNKWQNKHFNPSILKQALLLISRKIPCTESEIQNELIRNNLAKGNISLKTILKTAQMLRLYTNWDLRKEYGNLYVLPSNKLKLINRILSKLSKAINRWGVASIADITASTEEEEKTAIPESFVLTILQSLPDFTWLDQNRGWFWRNKITKRNRLITHINKMLHIAPSFSVTELRLGIQRTFDMRGIAPPKLVLTGICQTLKNCIVEGELIRRTEPIPWPSHKSNAIELKIANILQENGPVMSKEYLWQICRKEKIGHPAFARYLSYSPIIQRVGYCTYSTIGEKIPIGKIEEIEPDRGKPKVTLDYGQTCDGKPWITYSISEAMINTGAFYIPTFIKQFTDGDFNLLDLKRTPIGFVRVKKGIGVGLGTFFKRRGGEPGDILLLAFDSVNKQAAVLIGDEDLVNICEQPNFEFKHLFNACKG